MKTLIIMILPILSLCSGQQVSNETSLDQKVLLLLSRMTLDEKIGQMVQVDRRYLSNDNDIKQYHLGSLLSGGNGGPENNSPTGWADMYDQYQRIALETRLSIPLVYGVDAVHGHNNVSGTTIFPHNIGLGCTGDADLVQRIAKLTAVEVAATGIDWTFSPCVTVPQDIRWGRTYEGFSENPELTAEMGKAAVLGYQGSDLKDPLTIMACAKHFLGDGGTSWKTGDNKYIIDRGDTRIDEERLRQIHLKPYIAALQAGVGTVMASYNSWNGFKCHGHKYLLTDLLKEELGFEGFIISDWAGHRGISANYKTDIIASINAGLDMIMVPGSLEKEEDSYEHFLEVLKESILEGSIKMDRIDDAVRRILRIKFQLDLFDKPFADRSLLPLVGSPAHRETAREAVRKSVVVLKNKDSIIPLSKRTQNIHVAGSAADDLGMQCGGWTISWQGDHGPITAGTTILEGIRATVSDEMKISYSADGIVPDGTDVGIVVIGESPYAEGHGDDAELNLSANDLMTLKNMKSAGIPTVVIMISGRPLMVTEYLHDWNAFMAAWLPGTEGQGIADILFGDYPATGQLSYTWPRNLDQLPLSKTNLHDEPLFPFGYRAP
ncbi:MAG: glycoside hydrolase family 3 C-terminal domain-containing protein [Candidatus Marinimicrobia bacterium]|nr:glycoside hydrolase family 3 C-terminal domain-containing protein [Candidatus Neomarinimicrobiota bacterium]